MSTPKRQCAGGEVYHVLNGANGRLRIFKKPADFEAFERVLAEGERNGPADLFGRIGSLDGCYKGID